MSYLAVVVTRKGLSYVVFTQGPPKISARWPATKALRCGHQREASLARTANTHKASLSTWNTHLQIRKSVDLQIRKSVDP